MPVEASRLPLQRTQAGLIRPWAAYKTDCSGNTPEHPNKTAFKTWPEPEGAPYLGVRDLTRRDVDQGCQLCTGIKHIDGALAPSFRRLTPPLGAIIVWESCSR